MITIPTTDQVIRLNQTICTNRGNNHTVLDRGKIESAIHAAFYPGSTPFANGGLIKLAAALCFHICQAHGFEDGNKRTAVAAAITFLNINGIELQYPMGDENNKTDLAVMTEKVASGDASKEDLMSWFENHKIIL